MLRINQFADATALKKYHKEALARGDYYINDHERPGMWRGEAARQLGLDGAVTDEAFNRLCDNKHPGNGEGLTPRTRDDRTVAYDFNWHVPKGISLLHAVTGDERIVDAIRDSVHETMQEIEKQALTRVRVGGEDRNRTSGNLVWAEFVHLTTRPVDGVPDPHAHIHCVVFNATHDPIEERFKAAQFREIKRDAPYFEAAMYARLAKRLNDIGYATERRSDGWDLAGTTRAMTRKFSRRTVEIEELAAALGITDPKLKDALGAKTRSPKDEGLNYAELRERWAERLTPDERDRVDSIARGDVRSRDIAISTEQALGHAISHKFQNESVVSTKRLWESGLRYSLGQVSPEQLKEAAGQNPELLEARKGDERFVTTRAVHAEEQSMLAFARDGRGTCPAFERGQPWQPSSNRLNPEQRAALEHVLQSQDRVMLIRGGAGTGKTTLMKETVAALRSRGTGVVAVAPTAEASRVVLRKSGFERADTLQSLMGDPKLQASARNGLIWVDEAGLVGTRDMKRVFDLSAKLGARVLLTGDSKQHAPVQRGDALRILEDGAGIKPAELVTVVRQQGRYRDAVEAIAKGRFEKGFEILDQLGAIREISGNERPVQIARDYVQTIRKRQSCLVVAPTNAEGEMLSSLIRAEMRRHALLGTDQAIVNQLKERKLSVAERADPVSYETGQLIRFNRHAKGFKAGETLRVVGQDAKGGVRVIPANGKGEERTLPLHQSDRFGVFEERSLPLAVGERVRFTGGGRTKDGRHRIENGAAYELVGFTKEGHLKLDNGWIVRRDFGHIAHGYASTSHSSQGKTVDRVLISQGRSVMAGASAEQFYVSISRGRHDVCIYTDDRQALFEAVARTSRRQSATELVERAGIDPNRQVSQQRSKPSPLDRLLTRIASLNRLRAYDRTRAAIAEVFARRRERIRQVARADRGLSRGR